MDTKHLGTSIRNSFLVVLYILGVALFMSNGEKWFGHLEDTFLVPFMIVLLFSTSAAIVGGLVFGPAIYLYLDGKKKESVEAATFSVASLATMTLVALALILLSQ